jgi:hypothetical protein
VNLRVVGDESSDEDDSMSANPEPPHVAAGYGDVRGPRRRSEKTEGRWVIQYVEVPVDPAPAVSVVKECAHCHEKVGILHAFGTHIARTICGDCQGKYNRSNLL